MYKKTKSAQSSKTNTKPGSVVKANFHSLKPKPNPGKLIQRAKLSPGSLTKDDTKTLQRMVGNNAVCQFFNGSDTVDKEAVQKQENRTGMPDKLKTGIETLSGVDMSDIRVHRNSSKPATLQALAYTKGSDIHVAPGQERHLPHEAWHAVQQKEGRVQPTMSMDGVAINDQATLENEATMMGKKAVVG